MKKLLLTVLIGATGLAQAAGYKHEISKDMMCDDQAMMAKMLAESKRDGKISIVNPESFKNRDAGLYELVKNMDRIASENYQVLSPTEVARLGWGWCMDNIEGIVAKNR